VAGTAAEPRNLPVPVLRSSEPLREDEGFFARILRTVFRLKPGSIRDDLEVVLEAGTPAESGFSPEESAMLKNILGLRERRIEDVMVPRADIVAVQQDIALGELVKVFEGAGHSRLVVYNDTLDGPVGMVHIRDLIAFMTTHAAVPPDAGPNGGTVHVAGLDLSAIDLSLPLDQTRIMRQILFVPPSMPAIDLLAKMQATRIHLALVIDEYGGTDGLVSMEDIVEQIVGDIADEHDEHESATVQPQPDGSFLADARASLEEVTETIGSEFDVGAMVDDVDTLGGYLVTTVGRVPVRGELVQGPGGFEIEVLDADPRRVKRVKIHRGKARRTTRPRDGRRREAEPDATVTTSMTGPAEPTAPREGLADTDAAAPTRLS
jgi:CBS domain containing-hemolysin-like protein